MVVEQMKALLCMTFPCKFGGKHVKIKTVVIGCVIPLRLSRHSVEAAGIITNKGSDTAVVFGSTLYLRTTSSGHYALPLFSDDPHYGSQLPSGVASSLHWCPSAVASLPLRSHGEHPALHCMIPWIPCTYSVNSFFFWDFSQDF